MKQFLIFFSLLLAPLLGLKAQDIPPKPNPPRLVNDLANQLSNSEKAQLEQKLVAYSDSTSSQITIVTIPSLGEYPISDYAFALGQKWEVGLKGKNNGIVLLWAPKERKIFIATGEGMEGAIPDVIAKRIISRIITPRFKQNQFYQGLDEGIDAIFKYASGEFKADPSDNEDGDSFPPVLIFLIVFIVILFIVFKNKNNGRGGGGLTRGLGGPIFFPYTTHSGGGSFSGNWGGGGNSGGFGGFGGGSFGGGGAGGDY